MAFKSGIVGTLIIACWIVFTLLSVTNILDETKVHVASRGFTSYERILLAEEPTEAGGESNSTEPGEPKPDLTKAGCPPEVEEPLEKLGINYPEEKEELEHHVKQLELKVSIVILTVLVAVAIVLDLLKETVEENVSPNNLVLVDALWGELAVGGFLGLLSFLLIKTNALKHLSQRVFNVPYDCEGAKVAEIIENLHVAIFLVVLFYLIFILILVLMATLSEKEWRKAEKDILENNRKYETKFRDLTYHNLDDDQPPFWNIPAVRKFEEKKHNLEFCLLRYEFIHPRDPEEKRLDASFDFAEYLAIIQGRMLANIVHLKIPSWISLEIILIIFFAFTYTENSKLVTGMFVAFGFIILFTAVIVSISLNHTREQLLPQVHVPKEENGEEEMRSLSTKDLKINLAEPKFLSRRVKKRTCIGDLLFGRIPNKHEALFFLDKHGKGFLVHIIRILVFFSALYFAVFILDVAKTVWNHFNPWARWLLYILMLLPIFIMFALFLPHCIRRLVVTTSIEMMKKSHVIKEVNRRVRTKKTIRVLKILSSMKVFIHHNDKDDTKKKKKKKDGSKKKISEHKRGEYQHIFSLFDTDHSGALTPNELVEFYASSGHSISLEEAKRIVSVADDDGNGSISFEEFIDFMEVEISDRDMQPEEIAHAVFDGLDQDGSNSISVEEFEGLFQKFGHNLDKAEIAEIVRELDEDGDGEINKEEFIELLEKYHSES